MYKDQIYPGSFFKQRILPKLNEFLEIYNVQILTVICIHYWSWIS